jgi:hypothetical protein
MKINKNLFTVMSDINDNTDVNSGFTFNITIFLINEVTLEIEDIPIIMYKPCIYGLERSIEEHMQFNQNSQTLTKCKFLIKTDGIFGYSKIDEEGVSFSKEQSDEIKLKIYDILIEDKVAYVENKKNWWFWSST